MMNSAEWVQNECPTMKIVLVVVLEEEAEDDDEKSFS